MSHKQTGAAVAGIGVLSCLGRGYDTHRKALLEGRPGLGAARLVEAAALDYSPVGEVDEAWLEPQTASLPRVLRLARVAALEALQGAALPGRGVLVAGTTTGSILESERDFFAARERGDDPLRRMREHPVGELAASLASSLQLDAECHTFVTACSSSSNAIGYGMLRIALGAPWALALGSHPKEGVALIVGTAYARLDAAGDFLEALAKRGVEHGSPFAFYQSVYHSLAGQLGIHLGLRGIGLTTAAGTGSSDSALTIALDLLAARRAKAVLVVGADDVAPATGAAALLLSSEPSAMALLGCGLARAPRAPVDDAFGNHSVSALMRTVASLLSLRNSGGSRHVHNAHSDVLIVAEKATHPPAPLRASARA